VDPRHAGGRVLRRLTASLMSAIAAKPAIPNARILNVSCLCNPPLRNSRREATSWRTAEQDEVYERSIARRQLHAPGTSNDPRGVALTTDAPSRDVGWRSSVALVQPWTGWI